MKMMIGDEPITEGSVWLNGYSCRSELDKVRSSLGYCPQFDAHFDCMTGREHLKFYGSVKGIMNLDEVVDNTLDSVELSPKDARRLSKNYSGGMKRRLSFAIAILAQPAVILLDEPSTGMDALAKRRMWGVIGSVAREGGKTIVLTTHSMEEAEALCSRVTIMVDGSMTCLGSTQRLKDRYGDGYQVNVKIKVAGVEDEDYQVALEQAENFFSAAHVRKNLEGVKSFIDAVAGKADSNMARMVDFEGSDASAEGMQLAASCGTSGECTLNEVAVFVSQEVRVERFLAGVEKIFPNSEVTERNGSSIRFQVLKSVVGSVADVFDGMVGLNDACGIVDDYTVSQTTLEDIFRVFAQLR